MHRVIFACAHNACRSQMAASFLQSACPQIEVEAISAETESG
jgi:protein-tyrosine-phosphatase